MLRIEGSLFDVVFKKGTSLARAAKPLALLSRRWTTYTASRLLAAYP